MGWTDALALGGRRRRRETKALPMMGPRTRMVMTESGPQPQAARMDLSWRVLVNEGYKRNVMVKAAVDMYSIAGSEPSMAVFSKRRDGKRLDDAAPYRLFDEPNRWMDGCDWWSRTFMNMGIAGAGYGWIQVDDYGKPAGLWPLNAGQLTPVDDPNGWILAYKFQPDELAVPVYIHPERIIPYTWLPDPLNPIIGLSPMIAALMTIDFDSGLDSLTEAMVRNHGVPSVLISSRSEMDDEDMDEIRETWSTKYGGRSAGGVGVIDGTEVTVQRLGAGLDDINTSALREIPETRVSAAYRVPPVLLWLYAGLNLATNRATVQWLHKAWLQHSMGPVWRQAAGISRRVLKPLYGHDDAWAYKFDPDEVQALRELDVETIQAMVAAFQAGGVTVNDLRDEAHLDRDPAGDYYLRNNEAQKFGEFPEPPPPPAPPEPPQGETDELVDAVRKEAKKGANGKVSDDDLDALSKAKKNGSTEAKARAMGAQLDLVRRRFADQVRLEVELGDVIEEELSRLRLEVADRVEAGLIPLDEE